MAKPRYAVRDGELVLIRNPIQSLSGYRELVADPRRLLSALAVHDRYRDSGYSRWAIDILPSVRLARTLGFKYAAYVARRDRHVRDYDTGSEPFQVTARIFDAFVEAVLKQGALPIILLFPHRRDIARYREDGSRAYAPMTRYLRAKGYNVVDLMGAFHRPGETRGLDELAGGHYRPLGTALVARHIADYLRKRALTTVAAVEAGAAAMARRLGGSGGPTRPRHGGSEPDSDRGTRPAHR